MNLKTSVQKPRLALFDLDHTLLPLDSDFEWGEFSIRIGWADKEEFGRRNQAFFDDYLAGRLDVHDYVRFATAAVVQRGEAEATAAHQRFMDEVIRPAMKPAALALVQQQLARAVRLLRHITRIGIGRDVQRNKPCFALTKINIAVNKIYLASADAFYFRAGKHNARLGEL